MRNEPMGPCLNFGAKLFHIPLSVLSRFPPGMFPEGLRLKGYLARRAGI